MRKIVVLTIVIGLCLTTTLFAATRNVQRQISDRVVTDYNVSSPTSDRLIKDSAGTVFGVTMSARDANGWIAIYDSSDGSGITSSTEPKIEIQEATQYNTGVKDFIDGFKFYNGIYVEGNNAQSIIYYY